MCAVAVGFQKVRCSGGRELSFPITLTSYCDRGNSPIIVLLSLWGTQVRAESLLIYYLDILFSHAKTEINCKVSFRNWEILAGITSIIKAHREAL